MPQQVTSIETDDLRGIASRLEIMPNGAPAAAKLREVEKIRSTQINHLLDRSAGLGSTYYR